VIDERLAHEFQQRHFDGERGAFSGLYAECRHITEILAKAYAARHELQTGELDDTIQTILSRVLSRYRNTGYFIHSFSKVLNIEVVHELSNHKGPKAQLLEAFVPLETIQEPAALVQSDKQDNREGYYFSYLCSEHFGSSVILILRRGGTYKASILEIERITGRRWIYDNAERLFYIWKHLRNGKKKHHGEPGLGSNSGNKATDSGDQRAQTAGKQAQRE
jgi:hypothetical protein